MNILVGFDGSNSSKEALRIAQKYAAASQSSLVVVTAVVRRSKDQLEEIARVEKGLEYIQKDCNKKGIACRTQLIIRELEAGEALVEFTADNDIDELVIGVRKRSRVEKLLLGSNAQYIILNAPCPVLSVKERS
jgi:nucleotide-binding universal stress UspA family protein